VLSLVGADVRAWYAQLPKPGRLLPQKRPLGSLALPAPGGGGTGGGGTGSSGVGAYHGQLALGPMQGHTRRCRLHVCPR
jgi:hypothetical protein